MANFWEKTGSVACRLTRAFFGALMILVAFLPTNSFAGSSPYVCDSPIYVECNPGYYLSNCGSTYDGRTVSVPTSGGNSCNSCPDGYICAGGRVCPARAQTTITLDNATNGGSGSNAIYTTYNTGVYLNSGRTQSMTTSSYAVTIPTKTNATFLGYYKNPTSTATSEQYIGSNGRITSYGLTAGKGYTVDQTWYARFGECGCTKGTNVASCNVTGVSSNKCQYSYTCEPGYSNSGTTSGTFSGTAGVASNSSPNCATPNTITLVWNNGGHGTAPTTPATCTYDVNFDTASAISAPGYTFNGWALNNGDTYSADEKITCDYRNIGAYSGTVTFTAQWTGVSITINWDENGGNTISNGSCTYGGNLVLPSAPTRSGYTFAGWKTADGVVRNSGTITGGCTSTYIGVTSGTSTTIQAQWTANSVSCNAGYYLPKNSTSCSLCPDGKYCTGGTYSYDASSDKGITGNVDAGYYAIRGCKVVAPTSSSDYASGGECGECVAGSYSPAGASSCGVCPAGKYSSAVSSSCSNVSAGYYCTGGCTVATPTSSSDCLSGYSCGAINSGYYCTVGAKKANPTATSDNVSGTSNCGLCPTGYSGSDTVRNAKTKCYKTCSNKTVANASPTSVAPNAAKVYYSTSSNAYPSCTYTPNCANGYEATSGTNPSCNAMCVRVPMSGGYANSRTAVWYRYDTGYFYSNNTCTTRATWSDYAAATHYVMDRWTGAEEVGNQRLTSDGSGNLVFASGSTISDALCEWSDGDEEPTFQCQGFFMEHHCATGWGGYVYDGLACSDPNDQESCPDGEWGQGYNTYEDNGYSCNIAAPYKISYAGMTGATHGASHPTSVVYDSTFTVSNPTKSGYTFAGWKITGMDGVTHTYGSNTTTATSINDTKVTSFKNLRSTPGTVIFTAQWCQNCASVTGGSCSLTTAQGTTCTYSTSCNAGRYLSAGAGTRAPTCTACANGSYSATAGATSCTPCAPGRTNTGTGNTSCSGYCDGYSCPTLVSSWNTTTWNNNTVSNLCSAKTYECIAFRTNAGYASSISGIYYKNGTLYSDSSCSTPALWEDYSSVNNHYVFDEWNAMDTTGGIVANGSNVKFATGTDINTYFDNCDEGEDLWYSSLYMTYHCVTGWGNYDCGGEQCPADPEAREEYASELGVEATWEQNISDYDLFYRCSDPAPYTISYNLNGGTAGASAPTSVVYDTAFTVSAPTKSGYTFAGWSISGMDGVTHTYGSNTTTATSINGTKATSFKNLRSTPDTVTFTATWTANCNPITVDNKTRGGSTANTTLYKRTDSAAWYSDNGCSTAVTTIAAPAKTNATFSGYYTAAANTNTNVGSNASPSVLSTTWTVNEAKTIYAHYNCKPNYRQAGTDIAGTCTNSIYTITLKNYNNTSTDGTIYEKYATGFYSNATATTSITKATIPTRSGWTFRGYYTAQQADLTATGGSGTRRITDASTNNLPSNTTFTADTPLYAAWCRNCAAGTGATCSLAIASDGKCSYTTACKAGYYNIANSGAYNPSCTEIVVSTPTNHLTYNGASEGAGTAQTCPKITVTTPSSGATVKYGTASGTYNADNPHTITNTGSTTVYYKVTTSDGNTKTGSYTCYMDKANCPINTLKDGSTNLTSTSVVTLTYPTAKTITATSSCGNTVSLTSGGTAYITASGKTLTPVKVTSSDVTITASAAASTNFNAASATFKAKVNPADFTVTKPTNHLTYTGSAQTCPAVTVSGLKGNQTATIKYGTASGTYGSTTPRTITDAGSTTVYYQVTAPNHTTQTGSYTCYMDKADCPINVLQDGSTDLTSTSVVTLTYPTAKTITATSSCGATVSLTSGGTSYITASGKTLTPVKATSSDVTITASHDGDANHNAASATFKAKVNRGTCTVSFTNGTLTGTSGTLTYNGSSTTGTFGASTSGNGTLSATSSNTSAATASISNGTVTATWVGAGSGDNTASTTITVSSSQTDQYNSCQKTYTLTTAKKANTLTLSASSGNTTYPTSKTFTVSTNTSGGTLSVSSGTTTVSEASISGTTVTATAKSAGTATITVTSAATAYYKSATATYTLTVNPLACGVTIKTASNGSATTTGSTDFPNAKTFYVATNSNCKLSVSPTSGTSNVANASLNTSTGVVTATPNKTGTQTITITATKPNENDNYTTSTGTYTLTVNNGTIPDPTTPTNHLTYNGTTTSNGSAQSCPGLSSYFSGASVTYSSTENGTYGSSTPTITNAGSTTVWYKLTKTNYSDKKGSYTCTMDTKAVSCANTAAGCGAKSWTYDVNEHSCAITSVTAPSNATIKYNTDGGSTYSTTVPKVTNVADTKTVYYQISGANFTTTTGSYNCSISRANGTTTLSQSNDTVTQPTTSGSFTVTCPENGTVTASSGNTSVATVSVSGTTVNITYKTAGTAIIAANCGQTANYKASSANYTAKAQNRTVTVYKNNGTGTCAGASSTSNGSITCTYGGSCTAPTWNTNCNITNGSDTSQKILTGWTAGSTSGTAVALGANIASSSVTSLYAKWEDPVCSTTNIDNSSHTVANNTPTCAVTCTNGYSQSGYTNTTTTFSKTGTQNNKTVTVACAARTYKVTLDPKHYTSASDDTGTAATTAGTAAYWYVFNSNSPSYFYNKEITSDTDKNNTANKLGSNGYTITKPTLTGYTFGGYFVGKTGTGNLYMSSAGTGMNNLWSNTGDDGRKDITLYAKWTANTNTITLNGNGADGGKIRNTAMTSGAVTFTCTTDSAMTLPTWSATDSTTTTSIHKGTGANSKVFLGWATTQNATAAEPITTCPTTGQTYYAVWGTPTCSADSTSATTTGLNSVSGNAPVCNRSSKAGYYCSATQTGSAGATSLTVSCSQCPANYRSGGAGTTTQGNCLASCGAGTQVATQNAACTTPQGTTWYSGAHTVKYGSTSGTNVKNCATGYATPNTTTATDHDAKSDCTITCAAGYYIPAAGGGCVACIAGKYCTGGTKTEEQTLAVSGNCPAGTYSTGGAKTSACTSALTNYTASVCDTDKWSDAGASSCSDCATANGYHNSGTAAADHAGSASCKASCDAGYAVLEQNGACTTIQNSTHKGKWIAANTVPYGSTSTINTCPTNYQVGNGTTAQGNCTTSCAQGTAVLTANAACTTVTGNRYKTGTATVKYGATSPTVTTDTTSGWAAGTIYSCPSNYTISGTTAATHDARTDCTITCSAGTRIASANASSCTTPSGSWYTSDHTVAAGSASGTNVKSCVNANYTTANTTTKTDHDNVNDCKITCAAGKYVAEANAACTDIGSPYYRATSETVIQGATGTRNACADLTAPSVTGGTFSSVSPYNAATTCRYKLGDITKPANCASVATNTVSFNGTAWGTGYYTVTANPGAYISANNTAAPTCTQCTGATFSAGGTATSCTNCPTAESTWTQGTGTGWNLVTQCFETKNATAISSYCSAGVAKKFAKNTTTWDTANASTAFQAKAGSFVNGLSCTQCATGSYTASAGTQTSCTVCGGGTTTSGAGKTSCDATCSNNNSYDHEWATPSWNNNSPTGVCKITSCKAGSYYTSTNSGNTNTCTACGDGTFLSGNGHTTTACTSADKGYFVAGTGKTEQTLCAAGSYTNTTGQSACIACQNGTTNTGANATSQQSCGTTCSNAANVRTDDSSKTWTTATWTNNSVTNACTLKSSACKAAYYYNNNACSACPAAADHKRSSFPEAYYATKIDSTSLSNAAGTATISGCRVLSWISGPRGVLYEYATYNTSTEEYDTAGDSYNWRSVTAGYYLTDKSSSATSCTQNYRYYHNNLPCPAGSYCPGQTAISCSTSNPLPYTATLGLNSCSDDTDGNYENSAAGSAKIGQCYLTTTAGNYVATAGEGQVTCACGGYCAGGTKVYYNTDGGTTVIGGRTGCGAGKYNANTGSSASSACSTAAAGYYANSSCSQTACAAGKYSTGGASSCSNISAGYFCAGGAKTATPSGTSDSATGAACGNCASSNGSNGRPQYSAAGAGSCTECPAVPSSLSSRVINYGYYPAVHSSGAAGCYANFTDTDDTATFTTLCYHGSGDYGDANSSCQTYGPTKCAAGKYSTIDTLSGWSSVGKYVGHKKLDALNGQICTTTTAGYFSPEDATTQTQCVAGSYSAAGASGCTACQDGTTTSGAGQTSCNEDCPNDGGAYTWNTATWNSNNTMTNLCSLTSCDANYFLKDNNTCALCSTLGGGLYTKSKAGGKTVTDQPNVVGTGACYFTQNKGYYVTSSDATAQTGCPIGMYNASSANVYYPNTGQACLVCTSGYSATVGGGTAKTCTPCNSGYAASGSNAADHDQASDCKITCDGGSYVATAGAGCVNVDEGYWAGKQTVAQGSTGTRTACTGGLTTIGRGAGADEAGDCGTKLHAGNEVVYLRSDKKTSPSLHVRRNGKVLYGNLGRLLGSKLMIKSGGIKYSVYDDSMKPSDVMDGTTALDPSVAATSPQPTAKGTTTTTWSATHSGQTISGSSACTTTSGSAKYTTAASTAFSAGGSGTNCWCRLTTPYAGNWVFLSTQSDCTTSCAFLCGQNVKSQSSVRAALFN